MGFSCFIIGEGPLAVRCAEFLISENHNIVGLISSDPQLLRWARSEGVRVTETRAKLLEAISVEPFDFLFNILGRIILPAPVLGLPRCCAVNYHDAPLPRYAGTHATPWALINREQAHGITWHVMTEEVDAGDILKQRSFEIDPRETTWTLDLKCFEAAFDAFEELVGDLACGSWTRSPQDRSQRTYHMRYEGPHRAAILDWHQDAQGLDALCRALEFGPGGDNDFGLPKIAIASDFLIVKSLGTLSGPLGQPGTIKSIGEDRISVVTAEGEIELGEIETIDGQSLSISDVLSAYGLHEESRLHNLDSAISEQVIRLQDSISKNEPFWRRRLSDLQPFQLPHLMRSNSDRSSQTRGWLELNSSGPVKRFLELRLADHDDSEQLVAAFGIFLARLSGQRRFHLLFRHDCLKNMLKGVTGLYESSVPLKFDVILESPCSEVLESVLQDLSGVKRRGTFTRDIVVRHPELKAAARAHTVEIETTRRIEEHTISTVDLKLVVGKVGGTKLALEYNTRTLDAQAVRRIADNFLTYLDKMANAPGIPVGEVPLLADAERNQILVEWNDTQADYPKEVCLHHLFESQVEETPEAIAAIFGDQSLTYAALNRRANQLAHYLRRRGVGSEVLVGICAERTLEMIVALLGILKAGGAYVPLDPDYPKERLAFMMKDSGVPVLLTQVHLVQKLPDHGYEKVYLDSDWEQIGKEETVDPHGEENPSNLAYCIYTSGSTGQPKGVLVEHKGLCNLVTHHIKTISLKPGHRVLHSVSFSFDAATNHLFSTLCSGATVCLTTREVFGSDPLGVLRDSRITHAPLPASVLGAIPLGDLPELQVITVGAEACSADLAARWSRGRDFYNVYGPTETTIQATMWKYSSDHRDPPIGRPIANTQAYILDRLLQLVPVGVPGELHIGGVGVARCYHNDPELTAKKFIPDPFSSLLGQRLYKTGDLCRYLADGNIEFLGRIDDQVKIRGFRVEPGEIEHTLSQHPAVREAVVTMRKKQFVAYVIPRQESSFESDPLQSEGLRQLRTGLTEFLQMRLPEHMVPAQIVFLEKVPLTPSGKMDLGALPIPDQTASSRTQDFVAPSDQVEMKLAEIWSELLKIDQIGIHDDFFNLGGDSLIAVRMITALEEIYGRRLPLATFSRARTLEELAAILRREHWEPNWTSLVPLQVSGFRPPLFLMHPHGGNILIFHSLAQYLSDDIPIYALQSRDLQGDIGTEYTIESMAAHYLAEIRTVQAKGPYHLLGFCFGGFLALEVTLQLEASGESVAFLGMIQTARQGYPLYRHGNSAFRRMFCRTAGRVELELNNLKQVGPNYIAKRAIRFCELVRVYTRMTLDPLMEALNISPRHNSLPYMLERLAMENVKAAKKYEPRPCNCRVHLFSARRQPFGIVHDPTLGWSNFFEDRLDVSVVPGSKQDVMQEPNVRALAERVYACLKEVWEGSRRDVRFASRPDQSPVCKNEHHQLD